MNRNSTLEQVVDYSRTFGNSACETINFGNDKGISTAHALNELIKAWTFDSRACEFFDNEFIITFNFKFGDLHF